jgi:hypothetical protein
VSEKPAESQPGNPNTFDLFKAATFVEQLLATELSWIFNRLTWLFVSQSFCITAYTILLTSEGIRPGYDLQIIILRVGIPLIGVAACFAVAKGVEAAGAVAAELADERARLTREINLAYGTRIPEIGISTDLRTKHLVWTIGGGAWPQRMPWLMMIFWMSLVLRFDLPSITGTHQSQPGSSKPASAQVVHDAKESETKHKKEVGVP